MARLWYEPNNQQQVSKINGKMSEICELTFGTPQGGALGPLMFLVYLNDQLAIVLHSDIPTYADDVAMLCSVESRLLLHQKKQ